MNDTKRRKRTERKSVRKSNGRSAGSKYSPENIAIYLRTWKNDLENWMFKSIANDEAIRICLNKTLMSKEDFNIFCEYFKTNRGYGAYKRLELMCAETEEMFKQDQTNEDSRNAMKRVLKIRETCLVDPRKK